MENNNNYILALKYDGLTITKTLKIGFGNHQCC